MKETESLLELKPDDNRRLANLCGQFDENLRYIETNTSVNISNRGNNFRLSGAPEAVKITCVILEKLYKITQSNIITKREIHLQIQQCKSGDADCQDKMVSTISTRKKKITARSSVQAKYIEAMAAKEICFGIGPAGTGKTYLAVASAVNALESNSVRRVCLVRPAVEAGERLGFLPGDMSQKIDPYLRPLYDALHEIMGFERVSKLIEKNIIEVAPLAFMRGRSLNESFIILDEAQNTTPEQMKMFLTRIGFGSRAVITGDITQIDLPRGSESGLKHVSKVLISLPEVSFSFFSTKDVVRHRLVAEILKAYGKHEKISSEH